jgi:hypothetical protein
VLHNDFEGAQTLPAALPVLEEEERGRIGGMEGGRKGFKD